MKQLINSVLAALLLVFIVIGALIEYAFLADF